MPDRDQTFERVKSLARSPVLVDLRNVYQSYEVLRHGFTYTSIGRG